ncbi:MAG: hypothetical protein WBK97_08525 [Bacteroidales bacterium]|jgi:hypothetical protein
MIKEISAFSGILLLSLGLVIISLVLFVKKLDEIQGIFELLVLPIGIIIYIVVFETLKRKEIIQNLKGGDGFLAYATILLYFLFLFIFFLREKKKPPK